MGGNKALAYSNVIEIINEQTDRGFVPNMSCGNGLKTLAEKSLRIFEPEWKENRHVHENYNAITGEGCDVPSSDKFYHWGALLAAIALRNRGIR